MSSGPAEFVGFVGRRARVWLAMLVPLCVFWSLVAASFAGEVARSLEFVSVDAVRFAADTSVGWLPALAALFAVAAASRRAARATITPDHALIRPLRLPWPAYTIPLVDVVARRSTPSGVLLSAPAAVPRTISWLLAPLVPATTPEEQARAHAALDAPHVRSGESVTAPAGRIAGWGELVLLVVVALAWAVAAETYHPVLLNEVARLHALGAALVVVLAALALSARRRVHLGAETVSIGGVCVPWSEVVAIATAGPWLTLETRRHRRAARVGDADAARLRDAARERLARDGREALVLDVAPRWLRRRRRGLGLFALGLFALAGVAGPVRKQLKEDYLVYPSQAGHELRAVVVHRKHDATPLLVVFTEGAQCETLRAGGAWSERLTVTRTPGFEEYFGAPGETVDVDARLGQVRAFGRVHDIPVGSTVVHVRRDGVTASATPLGPASPALHVRVTMLDRIRPPWERIEYLVDFRIVPAGLDEVASCLGHVPDPLLRGVLDGTASTRCFSASSWGRLLVRIDRGRVVSAVADPSYSALAPCLTCAFREWVPDRFVRLGPPRRPSIATGELPSLLEARAALRAIEGGASVESATATWSTNMATERLLPANRRP